MRLDTLAAMPNVLQDAATTPNDKPIVHLDDVSLTFGEAQILEEISLQVAAGQTLAVIGESGSGKSSLLKLMNGQYAATSGVVHRGGDPIDAQDRRQVRRQTGYALQEVGLFPHLRVRENILLPLKLAGKDDSENTERAMALAEQLQLSAAQLQRYPNALSGGQQQRAGLCRALVLEPELLLLDEAFSGLDAITRNDALALFATLKTSLSLTTVMVTHDLNEARRVADALVVLKDGRVVRHGTRQDVLSDPQHPYAKQLIEAFLCD